MSGDRLIHRIVASCDECPFKKLQPLDHLMDGEDDHWRCNHWDSGGFVIAEVGTAEELDRCGDSVQMRIGKPFPDQCPLPLASPALTEPIERSRVVSLPDTDGA